jgi:hypothetical protein
MAVEIDRDLSHKCCKEFGHVAKILLYVRKYYVKSKAELYYYYIVIIIINNNNS